MNYRTGIERLQFITASGVVYNLHNPPKKAVISEVGFGLPETNMYTSTGAYQHGTTPVAYTLEPRDLSVTIRHNASNRSEYWLARQGLENELRISQTYPNLPIPGKLRKIYYINGVKKVRDIDCFCMGGGTFNTPAQNTWDAWGIDETLNFKAYNPVWYNPTPHVVTLNFGDNVINYAGTWEEYPSFASDGTFINLGFRNDSTDIQFVLSGISVGDTFTVNLTYAKKDIINSTSGLSMLTELSISSNLSNFSLQPDPLVAGGVNTIQLAADAGAPVVTMTYYDRYAGI
jgi:hypothetical protein